MDQVVKFVEQFQWFYATPRIDLMSLAVLVFVAAAFIMGDVAGNQSRGVKRLRARLLSLLMWFLAALFSLFILARLGYLG